MGVLEMVDRLIITIDGPAGTGKSSVAQMLAAELRVDVLDTGAMYRAAAAIVLDQAIPLEEIERISAAVALEDLHFDWSANPPAMLCSGRSVEERIRQPDVTAIVSTVAAIASLREHMVRKQRLVAEQRPRLVTEGRDQGTVVFPDAEVKFYLDASPEVRVRRRAEQLRQRGFEVDEATLLQNILKRDHADATRAEGPLRRPDDAISVDTSALSREEVVQCLLKHVMQAVPQHVIGETVVRSLRAARDHS